MFSGEKNKKKIKMSSAGVFTQHVKRSGLRDLDSNWFILRTKTVQSDQLAP